MIKDIDQRIGRAIGRIRQAFRVLLTGVDTSRPIILVQADGLAGEQLQAAEYFQHYGYTSNPPAGSHGVVLPIGGKTAHGIMIATEHGSYRLKSLQSGEVALYSDEGDHVYLKRGRVVEVSTQHLVINATADVMINSPQVTITGHTQISNGLNVDAGSSSDCATFSGTLRTTGDVIASGISLVHHRHPGVTSGASQTNEPV